MNLTKGDLETNELTCMLKCISYYYMHKFMTIKIYNSVYFDFFQICRNTILFIKERGEKEIAAQWRSSFTVFRKQEGTTKNSEGPSPISKNSMCFIGMFESFAQKLSSFAQVLYRGLLHYYTYRNMIRRWYSKNELFESRYEIGKNDQDYR